MKLSDVAPRLAKARDQRLEELRIAEWNYLAHTKKDRSPIMSGEGFRTLTREDFLAAIQENKDG